ncbi:MAG: hypothetical protein ACLUKE_17750 [Blautia wexlerae]
MLDYSDLPCMELLDDESGYYMDYMAGCFGVLFAALLGVVKMVLKNGSETQHYI